MYSFFLLLTIFSLNFLITAKSYYVMGRYYVIGFNRVQQPGNPERRTGCDRKWMELSCVFISLSTSVHS